MRELRQNGNNALYLSPIYGLVSSKYSREDDGFDSDDLSNISSGMVPIARGFDKQEYL